MGVKTSGTAKKKLREILKRCQNLKKPLQNDSYRHEK